MKVLTVDKVKIGSELPPLEVEVTPRVVIMGASASRDWQPQHHDHAWAVEKVGTKGIFLNTPNLAGWIERYLTDWSGPLGRLGRIRFRMRRSICAGDRMSFSGSVTRVVPDDQGCQWAEVDLAVTANGETAVECSARIAIPADPADSPWARSGARWQP
ncbi:MAG: hypothetical protein WD770_02275 [Actinomycetota bacterium]